MGLKDIISAFGHRLVIELRSDLVINAEESLLHLLILMKIVLQKNSID